MSSKKILSGDCKNHLYSMVSIMLSLILGYGLNHCITFIPPSLFGMMLLALGLRLGWVSAIKIEHSINWVIKNMGVCFVPAGVGIMEHFELIKHDGPIMLLLTIISTFMLMFIVGWGYQKYSMRTALND